MNEIIEKYLSEVVAQYKEPVVIETGCIREHKRGSTWTIAKILKGHGLFFSFEININHIKVCREICKKYNDNINYVHGDSTKKIREFLLEKPKIEINFAVLDSENSGLTIFREFRLLEKNLAPRAIVIVDDVLKGQKGKVLMPYLKVVKDYKSKIHRVGNGVLVIKRN